MKVKINFPLEIDESGYPPVSTESMWAQQREEGLFCLENIPFFAKGVSNGDIVRATEEEGELWYVETVVPSDCSTIRMIVYDSTSAEDTEEMLRELTDRFHLSMEKCGFANLIALEVSSSTDFDLLFDYLDSGEKRELWTYEVGAYREAHSNS